MNHLAHGILSNPDGIDSFLKFVSLAIHLKPYDYPSDVFNVFHHFVVHGLGVNADIRKFSDYRDHGLISGLIDHYSTNYGIKCFVEKTPTHTFCVDLIREYFPNCKVLHVSRHPLDVVASIKEFTNSSNWNPRAAARVWNEYFTAAGFKSDTAIKYDDLVFSEIIAKQLVSNLGLEWTEEASKLYYKKHKKNCSNWGDRLSTFELEEAASYIDWEQAGRGGYFHK